MSEARRALAARARRGRVVVKIGSGVITDAEGRLDRRTIRRLAADIAPLAGPKRWPFVVSSGAIAVGMTTFGLKARPRTMPGLQAAAAVGQSSLVEAWSQAFRKHALTTAQVLLTHADVADRHRCVNAQSALLELERRRAIAVINENDTVSTEEIAFGDNDQLAAEVASLVGADLLVLMSVAPGILDGRGARIPEAPAEADALDALIHDGRSKTGVGGMTSKLKSARAAARRGIPVVIAAGKSPGMLPAILAGEDVGTLLLPATERISSRRHWIVHTVRPRGRVVVDDGAVRAIVEQKRSLLPSGVLEVQGEFAEGDAVEIARTSGQVVARGLVRFTSHALPRIAGMSSRAVAEQLGLDAGAEAVHRDDLAVVDG
jgi:glutamate 5-kinase